MKLLSITVGGFRNIRRTTLQMQELMALISCNSYGKSNVITAIEFGLDFIHNAREKRQDMMGYVPYIPLNKETAKLDYNIVFEFLDNVHGTDMIGLYEIGFVWKKGDKTGRRITIESLKVKEDRPKQKFMQLIKRDEQNALYKASQEGRCSSKIKVFADELVVDKILNHDEWTYMELLEGLCSLRIYVIVILMRQHCIDWIPLSEKGKNILIWTARIFPEPFIISKKNILKNSIC